MTGGTVKGGPADADRRGMTITRYLTNPCRGTRIPRWAALVGTAVALVVFVALFAGLAAVMHREPATPTSTWNARHEAMLCAHGDPVACTLAHDG